MLVLSLEHFHSLFKNISLILPGCLTYVRKNVWWDTAINVGTSR